MFDLSSLGEKKSRNVPPYISLACGLQCLVFWYSAGLLPESGIGMGGQYLDSIPVELDSTTGYTEVTDSVVTPRFQVADQQDSSKSLSNELSSHVNHLAVSIGERNLKHHQNLCEAANYLKKQLANPGFAVTEQKFKVRGLDCFNIIAELKGNRHPGEILIVAAHYDSVDGSPGANDNGSGVAALLALAKRFSKKKPERTLRFVGFTNEEPPYFQNPDEMGSSVYARACKAADENIVGVISLETMGYYSEKENSQKYPPPLNVMYPSTGNFIGFVANLESQPLLKQVVNSFREHSKFPSEFACLPSQMEGVGWSDHWSFWQEGYAGIMVTDTAPFRYPHYHLATDTPDKLYYKSLEKVVEGLEQVITDLSKSPEKAEAPKK